jgi:hypothetical protein
MSDYVDSGREGWTELRVHGVAGTPPESMLQHPHVARVAGDSDAGFYRRQWDTDSVSQDTDADRLEAYSWGGLTAGSGQRALWLLLLPFLLVNVAFWALPYVARDGDGAARRRVWRTTEVVQRLFALSITLTLVLATISVSMDLVAWQCVQPGRDCTQNVSWLGFLTWSWLAQPGRRLVIGAAIPLATVVLLWWLANRTWTNLESKNVPGAEPGSQAALLENRQVWNGAVPVRKLRSVHVTMTIAVIGLFLLAPRVDAGANGVDWAVFGCAMLLILLSVVLVCLPSMTDRPVPSASDRPAPSGPPAATIDLYKYLPWLAFVVVAAAGVLSWISHTDRAGAPAVSPLPWFATVVGALLVAQVLLLAVMGVLLAVTRRWARQEPAPEPHGGREGHAVTSTVAWRGFGAVVFMLLALVLAGGFAAGLGLRVADYLGKAVPSPSGHSLVVPTGYFWAAALAVPVVGVLLAVVCIGALRVRSAAGKELGLIERSYPEHKIADAPRTGSDTAIFRRGRQIAREWARADAISVGEPLIGWFVMLTGGLVIAGVVGYRINSGWVYQEARWAVNIGTFLVGGFVLGMLYVGRQAYSSPGFRRTVGVLWDIGTFWPRATHPLAPPCYAERTMPDLLTRVRYLCDAAKGGRVVFSCHSQGSVIGAAVVLQLTYEESDRVALMTYGSPLRRLYARFFPAYFGVDALLRTGAVLVGGSTGSDADSRRRWPWRNLHRLSDPIGGPILISYDATETGSSLSDADLRKLDTDDIDRQLIDPVFSRPDGDTCYPLTRGHSDYNADPAFTDCLRILREMRDPPTPRMAPAGPLAPPGQAGAADPTNLSVQTLLAQPRSATTITTTGGSASGATDLDSTNPA